MSCVDNCLTIQEFNFVELTNIIIALLTLFLAYYIFVYQKRQDQKNINIQWLKELIVQPKLQNIYAFYDKIFKLKEFFNSSDLSESERIKIMDYVKREHFSIRKSFVDILQLTAPKLHKEVQENLDILVDGLTLVLDNDEFKLNNPTTYDREIESKISKSYNNLFASIFNYKG